MKFVVYTITIITIIVVSQIAALLSLNLAVEFLPPHPQSIYFILALVAILTVAYGFILATIAHKTYLKKLK